MCASSSTTQSAGCSREDRVEVHLFQRDAAIVDRPPGNDLEIGDSRLGVCAPVALHEADHDVDAFATERVRVLDHRIGLADARRGADVDPQSGALLRLQLRQHLFTGRAALARALESILARSFSAFIASLRTLYGFLPIPLGAWPVRSIAWNVTVRTSMRRYGRGPWPAGSAPRCSS